MKKLLLLVLAAFGSLGVWAQDTNVAAAEGVTAKIGNTDVSNILKEDGAQPNNYDSTTGKMEIVVDLTKSLTINAFSITLSGDRWVSEFTLSYSTNGTDYTDIETYQTGITSNTTTTIFKEFSSAVTAQYIKYTSEKSKKNVTNDNYSETIRNFKLISYATGTLVPPTHDDMYEEIYTKNNPSPVWQLTWNGAATADGEETYAGTPVKSFSNVKAIHFGKTSDTQDFTANAALYDKLSLDIYVESANDDLVLNCNNSQWTQALTLTAGWNTVTANVSDIASNLKILSIRHKDGEGSYTGPSLKLANIYFSKVEEDESDYEIATVTPSVSFVKKGTATEVTFTAKNSKGVDLSSYSDKVSVEYTCSEGGTYADGKLTITGDAAVTITATATKTSDNSTTTATAKVYIIPSAPKVPTAEAANVDAIYSSKYDRESGEQNVGWGGGPNPLWSTAETEVLEGATEGYKSVHVKGTGYGCRPAEELTTDYTKAYVALYPTTATTGKLYADGAYASATTFSVTPGQWNYIELAASYATNYVCVELVDETEFYLDHFYFAKVAEGEMDVTVTDGVATVSGTVTSAKVETLISEAGTASVINLSAATISEAITVTPTNTNAVVVVKGTERAAGEDKGQGKVTANNLVIYDGTWYRMATDKQLTITDANNNQPCTAFQIDAKDAGYKISRTIAADKYVTTYLPAAVTTIPDGLKVYKLNTEASTKSGLTFTEETTIAANTPYVLYTEKEVTLVCEEKNDYNLSGTPTSLSFADGATFQGNYKERAGGDGIYALQGATASNATVNPISDTAKIGAFRAYFTGLEASSSDIKVQFIDADEEETTGIMNLSTGAIEAGGAWYTLTGVRVAQPTKGLYIHNGKKVFVK